MKLLRFSLWVAAAALVLQSNSFAQTWPQRPVRFILTLGPGAGSDIGARLFADRLTKRWGQPVIVENRPGGDGVIAINAVLTARDDHILLVGPSSSFVGHPYTLDKLPYDPKELQPVARISNTIIAVAVPASLNVGSLKELVALARQQPGSMNWTSATTITDILFQGYIRNAGLQMTQISYKDTINAINDVISGRVHLYAAAYTVVRAQAQAGKLKVLALTNRSRAPGLDLPTVAEAGMPELTFDGLVGMYAARASGLSAAARDRIVADIKVVATEPAVIDRFTATAQLLNPGSGADLAASIEEQAAALAATAKLLGMKPRQ